MEFPRQEYWRKLPFPSPGDFPNSGIEPASPALQARSLPLSHLGSPTKAIFCVTVWGLEVKDEVVPGWFLCSLRPQPVTVAFSLCLFPFEVFLIGGTISISLLAEEIHDTGLRSTIRTSFQPNSICRDSNPNRCNSDVLALGTHFSPHNTYVRALLLLLKVWQLLKNPHV